MDSTTNPSKRRRRFAISLRASMLLILLVALLIGWKVDRAHMQRRLVAAIRAADGEVEYDFQSAGAAVPSGPIWLRRLVGDEYFQEVERVVLLSDEPKVMAAVGQLDRLKTLVIHYLEYNPGNALSEIGKLKRLNILVLFDAQDLRDEMLASLDGLPELGELHILDARLGDTGLVRLGHLPKLEILEISSSGSGSVHITDAGVEAVARSMPSLRELEILEESNVTDAALASVERLSKLTTIRLGGPTITDVGMAHLSDLRNLEILELGKVAITDEGLNYLRHLKKLRILNLESDKITNAGLAQISGLTNLEDIRISSAAISDDGLVYLASLTKLKYLALSRGQITDAGLTHLKGLTVLSDLNLEYTQVSAAGVDLFRKGRPPIQVNIYRDSPESK